MQIQRKDNKETVYADKDIYTKTEKIMQDRYRETDTDGDRYYYDYYYFNFLSTIIHDETEGE